MIYINLCIDWEGDHFRNLGDLNQLLNEIGSHVPVTHFICPAYFHRFPNYAKENILSTIRPHDEIGLHLHCFKSLIKNVEGVKFKTVHNYYRKNEPLIQFRDWLLNYFPPTFHAYALQKLVSGRGVPLSVYAPEEIKRILLHAASLLKKELALNAVNAFRAGGWLASDDVLQALSAVNIEIDSSAVSPEILSQGYEEDFAGNNRDDYNDYYPIFTEYIKQLWGRDVQASGFLKNEKIHSAMPMPYITKLAQPFPLNEIMELPNNCGATDFATMEKTFLPVFDSLLKENSENENQKPLFMNITCHQEGDYHYKKGMLAFYNYVISKYASQISFSTVSNAGTLYKAHFLS
jgi:hypothetical protein